MLVGDADPIFPADLSALSGVKEVCHRGPGRESSVVFFERFDLHQLHTAASHGMIVIVAMRSLNQDLVRQISHVIRDIEYCPVSSTGNAGRC